MKFKLTILQLVFVIMALTQTSELSAQIRRKPITPNLNAGGITPGNTPANTTNTTPTNEAPANMPPIVIKQENEKKEIVIRKPDKGNFTVEGLLQLSFGGTTPIMLQFPEIKARFFPSKTLAYRGTVGFNIGSETSEITANRQIATYTVSKQSIRAGGGVEVHVKGSRRFSPYYGAEGFIFLETNKINGVNTDDLKTYSLGAGYQRDSSVSGIYLGTLAGMDYYLSSEVFIGFELGVGINSYSTTVVGERKTMRGVTVSESNVVAGRGNSIGFRYSPGIRVGFKF